MTDHHSANSTSAVAHQFDDADQQRKASTLGMWVFLVTEVMFFGVVFAGYAMYRAAYPAEFSHASQHLNVFLGTLNTAILITSSFTMALSVYAASTGKRKTLCCFLILTVILGLAFLGIKSVEYAHKFKEHLVPGPHFFAEGGKQTQLFFCFYFAMTGLHAFHMIIGIGAMIWLLTESWKGGYSPAYHTPVELAGLYWHFVDIVWIFLFPLLYLIGRHG